MIARGVFPFPTCCGIFPWRNRLAGLEARRYDPPFHRSCRKDLHRRLDHRVHLDGDEGDGADRLVRVGRALGPVS